MVKSSVAIQLFYLTKLYMIIVDAANEVYNQIFCLIYHL